MSSANPAKEALDRAEAADGYRAACAASFLNDTARKGESYRAYFLQDRGDTNRLLAAMDEIPLTRGTDVVVLDPSADNGYPHTRPPNLICMPLHAVTRSTTKQLAETLRHEAIHVHQRKFPAFWKEVCLREGWTPVSEDEIPARFRERCRINPDTFKPQPFWAWEEYHIPLPLFNHDAPKTIADVTVKWLDLRNGTLHATPPSSFQARYGPSPPQPEHPFELLAVEAAAAGVTTDAALRAKLLQEK